MSEAKLILAKLKIVSETEERGMYLCDKEDSKLLLDYITNLQEENKELNDDNIWWNNRFKAVERDNRDYKSRIDKAIEYIETHKVMTQGHFDGEKWIYQYFELTCDPKELIEILDKENK